MSKDLIFESRVDHDRDATPVSKLDTTGNLPRCSLNAYLQQPGKLPGCPLRCRSG